MKAVIARTMKPFAQEIRADHRSALHNALIAFQQALNDHCDEPIEAEKLAIAAHAIARRSVKPAINEGRQPMRFGGD